MAREKAAAQAKVKASDAANGTPAGLDTDGHQTIARLADELLPLLIARLGASGLGELEVRQEGWRVRLRRDGNGAPSEAAAGHPSAGKGARPPAANRPSAPDRRADNPAPAEQPADAGSRRERGRVVITSPAVGYYQPRDGVAVGASVRGGDLLGHVEVLGVRQDVVAPESGILAALTAQPGEAVEYGQPLARLEPESRG